MNAFERIAARHDALPEAEQERLKRAACYQGKRAGAKRIGVTTDDGGLDRFYSPAWNGYGPRDGKDCFDG